MSRQTPRPRRAAAPKLPLAVAAALLLAAGGARSQGGGLAGAELIVTDVTDGVPGSRDGRTIAIDLDAPPAANAVTAATGMATDSPAHVVVTPAGGVLVADREADPSGLGPDPSGGAGRGGAFAHDPLGRDLVPLADGTACDPALPACGPAGVFVEPRGTAWSETAARLLVMDSDADPSLLGPDPTGGAGRGAVFAVDPASGSVTLVADGTVRGASIPGSGSAFHDPVAGDLAPDGTLYVVDASADPLGLGAPGAVFAVDVATGRVELAGADPSFVALRDVAVEPGGTLLLVDAGAGGGNGELVRMALAPPPNIVSRVGSALFGDLRAVAVDPAGTAYVVDAQADPLGIGASGAVFAVDVDAGAVTVASSTLDLLEPAGIAVVPPGAVASCDDAPGGSLRVRRAGCGVELTWQAADLACASTYRVWRGGDVRPSAWPPSFPHDPAFEDVTWLDEDGDAGGGSFLLSRCEPGDHAYLVVRVGPDGTEGELGAYGR